MKKYCLTKAAKEQILNFAFFSSALIALIIFTFGLVNLPFVLFKWIPITKIDTFTIVLSYIGILSWTLILSLIAIQFKRWLSKNIVEC